jgi:hypothetical protein
MLKGACSLVDQFIETITAHGSSHQPSHFDGGRLPFHSDEAPCLAELG